MSPSLVDGHATTRDNSFDVVVPKAKGAIQHRDIKGAPLSPPVADDYMYDFKFNHALPTTEVLGIDFPKGCDAQREADGIVRSLSNAFDARDAYAFTDLFLEHGKMPDIH